MRKSSLFIFVFVLTCSIQAANRLVLPYKCSFEQGEDLSDWVLNNQTAHAMDQWCIGTVTHSEGKQAMYISNDTGYNARFGDHPNTVCAYRTFHYPVSAVTEKYDISFDWRNFGDIQKGQLRVWYGRSSQLASRLKLLSETSGQTMTTAQLNSFESVITGTDTSKVLYNSEGWKTACLTTKTVTANSDDEWVLMFVWINQTQDSISANKLGACVDNIQIVSNRAPKPEHVQAFVNCEDSSMVISWESTMGEFILAYKGNTDEEWHRQEGITDRVADKGMGLDWSYRLPYMTEGVYDICMWSVNNKDASHSDTSACVTLQNVVNYCPDNHCIDYMHLDAAGVVCTYGTYADPYAHVGILDFGSQQKESRHTIMSDLHLLDERTNFRLKTVPDGALASVRLGNWNNNAEAETITYEYTVDSTDSGVLLLRYAIVLEDPEHDIQDQPYFRIRVLDATGQLIDDDVCAMAEYYAGYGAGTWNTEKYIEHTPMGTEGHKILWKDWSTVGLNLNKHHGQTVYVELTTKDCNQGYHYGYAYFTLDCTAGRIRTNNCAGAAFSEATAPEGFLYEWSRVENDSIVSHDRTIRVDASDTSPYACKCMFMENTDCSFNLKTYFQSQYPFADFKPVMSHSVCQTFLKLVNTSYIQYYEEGVPHIAMDKPKDYEWEIVTASGMKMTSGVVTPTVNCDPNGDTVYVTLHAYLASKNCHDQFDSVIIVPRITTPDSILQKDICQGSYVEFDDKFFFQDTLYTHRFLNQYGCDSVVSLSLRVHAKAPDEERTDTICSTQPYVVDGDTLRRSGDYVFTYTNQYGCDSVITLHLKVNQQPIVSVLPIGEVCSDEGNLNVSYNLQGEAKRVQLCFDAQAQQAGWSDYSTTNTGGVIHNPFSDTIRVGSYTAKIIFTAPDQCEDYVEQLPFTVRYRSSIIEQKWNDVLALLNNQYNGGYEFTNIHWYRNGEVLTGQTGTYIYLPGEFKVGDLYYAELTNQYGVTVTTCPIEITQHTDHTDHPIVRKQLVHGRLQIHVNGSIYDAQGLLIDTTNR